MVTNAQWEGSLRSICVITVFRAFPSGLFPSTPPARHKWRLVGGRVAVAVGCGTSTMAGSKPSGAAADPFRREEFIALSRFLRRVRSHVKGETPCGASIRLYHSCSPSLFEPTVVVHAKHIGVVACSAPDVMVCLYAPRTPRVDHMSVCCNGSTKSGQAMVESRGAAGPFTASQLQIGVVLPRSARLSCPPQTPVDHTDPSF